MDANKQNCSTTGAAENTEPAFVEAVQRLEEKVVSSGGDRRSSKVKVENSGPQNPHLATCLELCIMPGTVTRTGASISGTPCLNRRL